jgi:hypothetical protein
VLRIHRSAAADFVEPEFVSSMQRSTTVSNTRRNTWPCASSARGLLRQRRPFSGRAGHLELLAHRLDALLL